jgi:hypothetical protein
MTPAIRPQSVHNRLFSEQNIFVCLCILPAVLFLGVFLYYPSRRSAFRSCVPPDSAAKPLLAFKTIKALQAIPNFRLDLLMCSAGHSGVSLSRFRFHFSLRFLLRFT